jgi:hypothetical protein
MGHNHFHAPDSGPPEEVGYHPPASQPDATLSNRQAPRLADREVPLPNNTAVMLMHQWLDGDAPVAAVLATAGGNESVDLWTKINDEAELLRSRTTPLYVHKRIMESLPDDIYRLHEPWYRRPVTLNPTTMIVGAAALLGFGALVAKLSTL